MGREKNFCIGPKGRDKDFFFLHAFLILLFSKEGFYLNFRWFMIFLRFTKTKQILQQESNDNEYVV